MSNEEEVQGLVIPPIPPLPRLDIDRDASGLRWDIYVDGNLAGPSTPDQYAAAYVCLWLTNGGWRALNTARREE